VGYKVKGFVPVSIDTRKMIPPVSVSESVSAGLFMAFCRYRWHESKGGMIAINGDEDIHTQRHAQMQM